MEIEEISFVDKGANQKAYVLFYKRENMEDSKEKNDEVILEKSAFDSMLASREFSDYIWMLSSTLGDTVKAILVSDEDGKEEKIVASINSMAAELKNKVYSYSLAKRKIEEDANVALAEANKMLEFVSKLDVESSQYFIEQDEAIKNEILDSENPVEEVAKRISTDEVIEYEGEKIAKSKVGAAAFEVISKLAKDKEESEAKLRAEIEKRQTEETISKAKDLLKGYPLEDATLASVYQGFAKLSEEDKKNFEAVFKAGQAALEGLTVQKSSANATSVISDKTPQEKVSEILEKKYKERTND